MTVTVTELKAKCLSLVDQVQKTGHPIIITKHGKVVAKLLPEHANDLLEETLNELKGSITFYNNPFAPVVADSDIEAER
jgi:prevent-host-death family protein